MELMEIGKNMENQQYKTKYFLHESCKCVYMSTMKPLKTTRGDRLDQQRRPYWKRQPEHVAAVFSP